jgi:hypothetical protein
LDFQTRDRVAKEYFEKEHYAQIWGHSSGSLKFPFFPQYDGWLYWSKKGIISISKVKGTTKSWVQPYDFNENNPPRLRKLLIGCVINFGNEVSVSLPKNKADDLISAYYHKQFMRNVLESNFENFDAKVNKKTTKKKTAKKTTTKKTTTKKTTTKKTTTKKKTTK